MLHISLTENLEAFVRAKVESGLYSNASEVVREALRLMHARDEADEARHAEFKRAVLHGYEQARRGEFSTRTPEEIARAVEERHNASHA